MKSEALDQRVDAVLASARPPAEKVMLLEQVQLAVDAVDGTPKRKRRRKRLNIKIEAAIGKLEAISGKNKLNCHGSASRKSDVVVEKVKLQKGYKKLANGRVTSFFHRDIDDEAKKLIGNTSPSAYHRTNRGSSTAPQNKIAHSG